MSLAAASPSDESADMSLTESDDSLLLNPTSALSFESLDSFCPQSNMLTHSHHSLDSVGSMDSLPRCYSIPNSETPSKYGSISPKYFNTWTKSSWKKRYPFLVRSETNLLDISPNKLRNVFRRTIRINKHSNMNSSEKKVATRQFHSCDGLDTIGDLMGESKTVTAVVSKGASNGCIAPLSYTTSSSSLWYPESVTTSSDSLFIGHRQDFKSICWSQQRRKSGAMYLTGSTDELKFSGTAEELRFEETEEVYRTRANTRRLSDIGTFSEVTVKVKVPASILCSKKGFGKEIFFTLCPTANLFTLLSEIEKFTGTHLMKYKLCPGLVLHDCIEFWRSDEELNLNKELQLCTATEETPTLHFRVISKDRAEMEVKISITLPPMVIAAQYNADSTTADLLSNVINSPKLSETDIKRKMQKFGLYHPRYKVFLRTDELVSFYDIGQCDVLELKTRTQGVGGQSLYLHVNIADEKRTVLVVINSDVTVSELISKILAKLDTGTDSKWNYFGIYLPSNDSRQGGWMDDFKMLNSYSLKSVDKVELRARFRMFIFDLQVYSSSQQYTRHFVNMFISDKITAGEVLRIITSTNCLDYPKSWYGVFLHDNERILDNAKLCAALENKGISKQDSLVVHMLHQPIHVSLGGEQNTAHTFMVDFSMPLQQLHSIFCRYYGIRVPAACVLQHNGQVLDMTMCAIKNKLNPNSAISINFKRILRPMMSPSIGRCRMKKKRQSVDSTNSDICSVKSTSDSPEHMTPDYTTTTSEFSPSPTLSSEIDPLSPRSPLMRRLSPSTRPASPLCTDTPLKSKASLNSENPLNSSSSPEHDAVCDILDEIVATATKGESTVYEPTNSVETGTGSATTNHDNLTSNHADPTSNHADPTSNHADLSVNHEDCSNVTKFDKISSDNKDIMDISKLSIVVTSHDTKPDPTSPECPVPVVMRKAVERVKRAQSKIYEEDDINIWDDESPLEETLIRESNGQIKNGTFNRFIELLTDTQNYQINFVKVFLLTYQAFTTPKQLLRKLVQRYNVPRDSMLTMADYVTYRIGIQNGVINCLKLWVTDGDDFHSNSPLQKEFMQFIHTCISHDNPQQYRILRQKLLVVRGMVQNHTLKKEDIETPPLRLPPNLPPTATLFDHGPYEIARQLTMLDFHLFAKIKAIELVNQAWVKPKYSHQAKNILHFAERMNTLTRWAATSILAQKDKNNRAKMITDFINIADELHKLNNFSSFIAIINALEGSAISRLHSSWNKVERKICVRNDELYDIILPDSNFKRLRGCIAKADPPCIPYVGLFMSDLTFATECNPTVVNGMINFVKCKYINDIINRLKLYQQKPYHFEVVPSIVAPLQQLHALDEETLYEMSLQIEPKKPK